MKKLLVLIGLIIIGILIWYFLSPFLAELSASLGSEKTPVTEEQKAKDLEDSKNAALNRAVKRLSDDEVVALDEPAPAGATLVADGTLAPFSFQAAGQVKLLNSQGKMTLRFENVSIVNGPKLHVYLATNEKATDFVDLGLLKGIKGNMNYDVPAGTDTTKYKIVLLWSEPFGKLFSFAVL